MSDDTDSNVVHLPARGSDSGAMPDAPDGGDFFYSEPPGNGAGDGVPPESPEETTMELPPVRAPISPEMALRETGIPGPPEGRENEYADGEYAQPRSIADRLGDWLDYRLEVARERRTEEASFREAEIARKAALIGARTAREIAVMEQNGKLHAAMMKAKGDKAAARGKAGADRTRSSSSGMGSDKGRSKAGGAGGSRGGGGSSGGGSGRGTRGGTPPKGAGKGAGGPAGGRGGGRKGNESSGGTKGRQNGSGGAGAGKGRDGKGSSAGSGKSASGTGASKGDGRKKQNAPASPRAERRRERAAARQQRLTDNQAAKIADRSKDRDRNRADKQAAREERRAAKAERTKARREKRDKAKTDGTDRTTLGVAMAEEAGRRWDKRRKDIKEEAATDGGETAAKPDTDTKDHGAKGADSTEKKRPKDGPEPAADDPKNNSTAKEKEPKDGEKAGEKPSDGSGGKDAKDGTGTDSPQPDDDLKDDPDDDRSFYERLKDHLGKPKSPAGGARTDEPPRMATPEDFGYTMDRPGGPARSPGPGTAGEDIVDAVIVDDPADTSGARVSSPAGLPRAPEPHTARPGTTRPTTPRPATSRPGGRKEHDPMTGPLPPIPKPGQHSLAAKHRTNITFEEYLVEMANLAVAAKADGAEAERIARALRKIARALMAMAADLLDDHNLSATFTGDVTNLSDDAARMKAQAERAASACMDAAEGAILAARSVARVYGQDVKAKHGAGLAHVSAAAHHD